MEAFQKEFDCIREETFVNLQTVQNLQKRLSDSLETITCLADVFLLSLSQSLKVLLFSDGHE